MPIHDIAVRSTATLFAVIPAFVLVREVAVNGDSQHGEMLTPSFYIGLLGAAFFGVPGIYVAKNDLLESADSAANRRKGIRHVLTGVGLLSVGMAGNLLLNLLGWLTGAFAFLWYGIFGLGAVMISLGVLSCLSGRDLVNEMSDSGL